MFGNVKKQAHKGTSAGKNRSLAQLGLMDISGVPNNIMQEDDDMDDDDDLEAELAALMSGEPKMKSAPKRKAQSNSLNDVQKLTEACMKDDVSDDEEIDVDDSDLLSELQELVGDDDKHLQKTLGNEGTKASSNSESLTAELQTRLECYLAAEDHAKVSGNSSKTKRYNRAIKTLNEQLKMAKAGKHIAEDEIPPLLPSSNTKLPQDQTPVQIQSPSAMHSGVESPSREASSSNERPSVSSVKNQPEMNGDSSKKHDEIKTELSENEKNSQILIERRDQYKEAALKAKVKNDKATAIKYIGIMKQFDTVISALANGQPIDLSKMPPPPSSAILPSNQCKARQTESEIQKSNCAPQNPPESKVSENATSQSITPATPVSIIEGLNQRLEKFKATAEAAKLDGNNSKARRIGRIVKQYNEAIRDYKAGKSIDMEELPSPPGCPPLLKEGSNLAASANTSLNRNDVKIENAPGPQEEILPVKKAPAPQPSPSKPSTAKSPPSAASTRPPIKRTLSKDGEKQINFLLQRQKYFKMAALDSKKAGNRDLAMNYLKNSKGIDQMIEAARCGLPVDIKTVPVPPQLKEDFLVEDFEMVEVSNPQNPTGDSTELYATLEKDLLKQLRLCLSNKDMLTKLGDIALASKFENLAIDTKKDIQVIRNYATRKDPVPKFHYETRTFSIVQCNPTLSDNEMELTIIRGINLPGTKDLDTFIRFEFPHTSDTPQTNKTNTVKNTTEPVFNAKFILEINRKAKSTARLFRRNTLKIEVWSKGGLFSGNSLIGTVKAPLNVLESNCQLHDSYEICNGRKACGGKLELKIRLKEPLLTKQVETLKERWLVIGT